MMKRLAAQREHKATVSKAVMAHFDHRTRSTIRQKSSDQNVISVNVSRVEVRKDQLAIWLKTPQANEAQTDAARPFDRESAPSFLIPWCKPPSKKSREILLPPSVARQDVRPIKVERRAALLRSIARGRAWLEAVVSGVETVEDIAARRKRSVRHVNMTISMAFIAPGLVKAAVEGRLPRGIGIANLRDAPAEWSRQYERLGLAQP
jgi:site-specific DNA recombinase